MTQQFPPPHGQPDPHQWQGYQPPPPAPRPKKSHGKLAALALLILALFVACAIAGQNNKTSSVPTAPSQNTVAPAPAAKQPAQSAAPAAPVAPSGPATSVHSSENAFGGATYEVGTDIVPGKWKTTGPTGDDTCYWARLSDTSGSFESINANGNVSGPTTITIGGKDKAVEFRGGGCTWTKVG